MKEGFHTPRHLGSKISCFVFQLDNRQEREREINKKYNKQTQQQKIPYHLFYYLRKMYNYLFKKMSRGVVIHLMAELFYYGSRIFLSCHRQLEPQASSCRCTKIPPIASGIIC